MPSKRGTCPICKREDVLMPGPKCSRCYDRTQRGVDVLTGKPVAPFRAHDHVVKTTASPLAGYLSTIVVVPEVQPELVAPPAVITPYTIDPVELLDTTWLEIRERWINKFLNTGSAEERLKMTHETLACLRNFSIWDANYAA